jgi:ABC-type transporter Mla subunit MlaD
MEQRTMTIEDFALRFEGFTDQQIAQIHAALAHVEHLVGLVKANLPEINAVIPILQMVVQVINAKQKELGQ